MHLVDLTVTGFLAFVTVTATNELVLARTRVQIAICLAIFRDSIVISVLTLASATEVHLSRTVDIDITFFIVVVCASRGADFHIVFHLVDFAVAGLHAFMVVTAADERVLARAFSCVAVRLTVFRDPIVVLAGARAGAFEVRARSRYRRIFLIVVVSACRSTDLLTTVHLVDIVSVTAGCRAFEVLLTLNHRGVLTIEGAAGVHTDLVAAIFFIDLAVAGFQTHTIVLATDERVAGWAIVVVAMGVFAINHFVVILALAGGRAFEVRGPADHRHVLLINSSVTGCRTDLFIPFLFVGLAIANTQALMTVIAADERVSGWALV